MATLTKSGTPSPCSMLIQDANKITKPAGEAIAAGDMVYVKSDDKLWKANGTAANALALSVGMATVAQATAGEPVTAAFGVQFHYGSGLTPGARYYVSNTAGALDDAATIGGTVAVAYAVDATRIFVFSPTR
jgi:hypothetical protein